MRISTSSTCPVRALCLPIGMRTEDMGAVDALVAIGVPPLQRQLHRLMSREIVREQ
jgi:hypothetical protein